MKIYEQDCAWAGQLVVIANNEQEARAIMSEWPNYDPNDEVREHEIVHGLCIGNIGDL